MNINKNQILRTKDIVYISLFAAIIAALGLFPKIPVPSIPVPITAQSLGVMLAGSILGAKRGGLAILLFVVLVGVGMPLLAGGRGGLATITTGVKAGYIWGFVVGAFVTGYLTEKMWYKYNYFTALLCNATGGVFAIYLCGIPWLSIMADMPLSKTIILNIPFVAVDLVKVFIASAIAITIKKSYPLINR